jgi:hypothetical protein
MFPARVAVELLSRIPSLSMRGDDAVQHSGVERRHFASRREIEARATTLRVALGMLLLTAHATTLRVAPASREGSLA